jgi:hypothetical protein
LLILFDQGTPVPLRQALTAHKIETAYERGWSNLKNGELLASAEAAGFQIFVTTDKNLKYQQNLENRTIAIVSLSTTSWPRIQLQTEAVLNAVNSAGSGSYIDVEIL